VKKTDDAALSGAEEFEKTIGKFITFEGTEGCGKTTQARMVAEYLSQEGWEVVMVREPGGTAVGEKIREILLDTRMGDIAPITEALLFAADRAQQVRDVVRPALQAGRIVVADRYVDSSLAYQGVGRGCGLEAVKNLNDWATGELEPDLTIMLDLPLEEGLERTGEFEKDRIERESLEFHRNVRHAYIMLEQIHSRFVLIDGRGNPGAIHERVLLEVNRVMQKS
jgi:dTMP kinase